MPLTIADERSYSEIDPQGIAARIAVHKRREMYRRFIGAMSVDPTTTILDVGVSNDRSYDGSNYLERWHPHKDQIVATGIDDASFLNEWGVSFLRANALALPFRDASFDVVHCAATIEHVGNTSNQRTLVHECARVARRGFFITTPNRWFPIDVHTAIPLLHWLPKSLHRSALRKIGLDFYASEMNLNLMGRADLASTIWGINGFKCGIEAVTIGGFTSNLLLIGRRVVTCP